MSQIEDLEKLAELRKKGIITQEEFDAQKKNILENIDFGTDKDSSAKLSPLGYYKLCWKKYIQFSGRASRSEYWWFYLFNFLVGFALGFCSGFLGFFYPALAIPFNACYWIYTLAVLLPSWAVFVRRYHDIGKSAWFAFTGLFIFLGWLILTVLLVIAALSGSVSDSLAGMYFVISGLGLCVVSIVWYIVFPCIPSQEGSNKYGPQP